MLYYPTIDTPALELLGKLMQEELLAQLRLAGGTSLALQIGHRKSADLDLFGLLEADDLALSKCLDEMGSVTLLKKTPNIHIFLVNGIKVDIVNYHYPWLQESVTEDQLRLAALPDIAAMKLAAITGRGTRKDFIDLYFLLQHFTLQEMLDFYSDKYKDGSSFMVLKSLTYFDDAATDPDPHMLISAKWSAVKKSITEKTSLFLNSL